LLEGNKLHVGLMLENKVWRNYSNPREEMNV